MTAETEVILSVSLKSIVRSFREKDYAIRQMEFGSYGAGCPFAVFSFYSVRSKTFSGHDLLEQGKKQPDYFGETGQQPAGAYGGGEMERVYSGICGMRHDMKNTISVIMQLAAGKEDGL